MHRANVLDVVVQLHIVKTMVKILTQFTKASIITNAYTAVPVFTAVCRSVFCSMSQKTMQLGSRPYLTYKCSTMSPENTFISESKVKGQRLRTRVTKTLPA